MEISSKMRNSVQWVKGVINGDESVLKEKIIQLYRTLVYKTLSVPLDNVSDLTIKDLKEKINENLSDDQLIIFLRGKMEIDNPMVFLNYIVHCVEGIDYKKNRGDDVADYYKHIFSYLYFLYCVVRNDVCSGDCNIVLNVSQKSVDCVVNKVLETENISGDDLYSLVSKCFKDDNRVKSIGSIYY